MQGLIRSAGKEIHRVGREAALPRIAAAISQMRRVGKVRVPYFCDLLARQLHPPLAAQHERDIVRRPGNPLLRYAPPSTLNDPVPSTQESLL